MFRPWLNNWENRHIIEHESPASPDETLDRSSTVSDWREVIAESNYYMTSTPIPHTDSSFSMEETLSVFSEENTTSGFHSMSQTYSFDSTMVEESSTDTSNNENNSLNENMDENKENVPPENEPNIVSRFDENLEDQPTASNDIEIIYESPPTLNSSDMAMFEFYMKHKKQSTSMYLTSNDPILSSQ